MREEEAFTLVCSTPYGASFSTLWTVDLCLFNPKGHIDGIMLATFSATADDLGGLWSCGGRCSRNGCWLWFRCSRYRGLLTGLIQDIWKLNTTGKNAGTLCWNGRWFRVWFGLRFGLSDGSFNGFCESRKQVAVINGTRLDWGRDLLSTIS